MTEADRTRLIVFARHPTPGKTKTRLIPLLGAGGAAALARRLTLRTLRTAKALPQAHSNVVVEVRYDGGSERAMQHWLGSETFCREQGPGDLGQRMARAFEDSFREGSTRSLIIGADCPDLTADLLNEAFQQLLNHSVVIGPATDGGYYLIGLSKPVPELFAGIEWGTGTVRKQSIEILHRLTITPHLLEPLDDVDRPEDVPNWQQKATAAEADLSQVSVVIPALNEAAGIEATLRSVQQAEPDEIIVVDGGSQDGTPDLARHAGVRVLTSGPGRALQMNTGAAAAQGNTLLFLHGDTLLPSDWVADMACALSKPGVAAGAFGFELRESFPGKRIVEFATNLRSRGLRMPYGDQALFLRRAYFEELGGFADMPIMEDYELVRRLRRYGRIITLHKTAKTSGRRWQEQGWFKTTLTNQLIVVGYHLRVSPARLARWYRKPQNPWKTTGDECYDGPA